jgi:hypothetical protein
VLQPVTGHEFVELDHWLSRSSDSDSDITGSGASQPLPDVGTFRDGS